MTTPDEHLNIGEELVKEHGKLALVLEVEHKANDTGTFDVFVSIKGFPTEVLAIVGKYGLIDRLGLGHILQDGVPSGPSN